MHYPYRPHIVASTKQTARQALEIAEASQDKVFQKINVTGPLGIVVFGGHCLAGRDPQFLSTAIKLYEHVE